MISIFIRTIVIYIILNIMLKLMGKRQIGELEVNELVSTLLISEIAAIPISDNNIALFPAITPIFFISAIEVIISSVKNKSAKIKHLIEGEPVYIIYKGRIQQKALRENRISINELLTEMRTQGIADVRDIRYGILEQNGKFSLLKASEKDNITKAIVIDSEPNEDNLNQEGLDTIWLSNLLKKRNLTLDEIFLMTISEKGDIDIILKEK